MWDSTLGRSVHLNRETASHFGGQKLSTFRWAKKQCAPFVDYVFALDRRLVFLLIFVCATTRHLTNHFSILHPHVEWRIIHFGAKLLKLMTFALGSSEWEGSGLVRKPTISSPNALGGQSLDNGHWGAWCATPVAGLWKFAVIHRIKKRISNTIDIAVLHEIDAIKLACMSAQYWILPHVHRAILQLLFWKALKHQEFVYVKKPPWAVPEADPSFGATRHR